MLKKFLDSIKVNYESYILEFNIPLTLGASLGYDLGTYQRLPVFYLKTEN